MNVSSYSQSLKVFMAAAEEGRLKANIAISGERGSRMDSVYLSKEALIRSNAMNTGIDMSVINLDREKPYATEADYEDAIREIAGEGALPENIELIKRVEEQLYTIMHSSANDEEAEERGVDFYAALRDYIYQNSSGKVSYDDAVSAAEEAVAAKHKAEAKNTIFTDMAKLHGTREWKVQYLMKVYSEQALMGDLGAGAKLRQLERYMQALDNVRDIFAEASAA